MNVPTSLVEKMFSISSEDIYLLGPEGINLIAGQTPAFDEWKKSRCGTASPHYGEFVKWFKCDVDVWDEEKNLQFKNTRNKAALGFRCLAIQHFPFQRFVV